MFSSSFLQDISKTKTFQVAASYDSAPAPDYLEFAVSLERVIIIVIILEIFTLIQSTSRPKNISILIPLPLPTIHSFIGS